MVTTMKMISLTRSPLVCLSRMLIRTLTSVPAMAGTRSIVATSLIWSTGTPTDGAISELTRAFCDGVPEGPDVSALDGVACWRCANPVAVRWPSPRPRLSVPSFRFGRLPRRG